MHRKLILLLALFSTSVCLQAQGKDWRKTAKEFHNELNQQYGDPEDSPLDSLDRIAFKRLHFFPIRKKYCVQAKFIRTADAVSFEMPTASGKTKKFVKYGELHFELKGKKDTLFAYQNLKLAQSEEFANYLFIPFKDHSSGFKAYGGGRYIDWKIPTSEDVVLDLNQCYNPYCAYSTGWNCPIPPAENYIDQKVHAGVKKWKGGH